MISFILKDIKNEAKPELDLIQAYGHCTYNFFSSVLSRCKTHELIVEVHPGQKLSADRFGFSVEVNIFKLSEDADLDADDYSDGSESLVSVDPTFCRTRAQVWEVVSKAISDLNK